MMAEAFEIRLSRQIADLEERRAKLQAELARIDGHIQGLRQALAYFRQDGSDGGSVGSSAQGPDHTAVRRLPDPEKSPAWKMALFELESAPLGGVSVDE